MTYKCREAFNGWDVLLLYIAKPFLYFAVLRQTSSKDPWESLERC